MNFFFNELGQEGSGEICMWRENVRIDVEKENLREPKHTFEYGVDLQKERGAAMV